MNVSLVTLKGNFTVIHPSQYFDKLQSIKVSAALNKKWSYDVKKQMYMNIFYKKPAND